MNVNTAWVKLLQDLIDKGAAVNPRDQLTKELMGYQSTIDMSNPIVTVKDRKMNYNFMFGEAYHILSGSNRVGEITPFMQAIENFSDDGITFAGAYGPKVMEQISYVVDSLKRDTNSRQAVLSIWRERPTPSKDIPCTLTLQFMIRDGKLNCFANMRSSDAWLGWVYDVFNFSMISHYICNWYNLIDGESTISLGHLVLNAASQHLYEQHWDQANAIVNKVTSHKESYIVTPNMFENYEHPDVLLNDLMNAGRKQHDSIIHLMKSEISSQLRKE